MEYSSQTITVGTGSAHTNFNHDNVDVYQRLPLPGIIIFVHGVNSDAEWYRQTEQGLCAGLNERLKRCDQHMVCPTAGAGQLKPVSYLPELTADGFLNPDRSVKSFIANDNHFRPTSGSRPAAVKAACRRKSLTNANINSLPHRAAAVTHERHDQHTAAQTGLGCRGPGA